MSEDQFITACIGGDHVRWKTDPPVAVGFDLLFILIVAFGGEDQAPRNARCLASIWCQTGWATRDESAGSRGDWFDGLSDVAVGDVYLGPWNGERDAVG